MKGTTAMGAFRWIHRERWSRCYRSNTANDRRYHRNDVEKRTLTTIAPRARWSNDDSDGEADAAGAGKRQWRWRSSPRRHLLWMAGCRSTKLIFSLDRRRTAFDRITWDSRPIRRFSCNACRCGISHIVNLTSVHGCRQRSCDILEGRFIERKQ